MLSLISYYSRHTFYTKYFTRRWSKIARERRQKCPRVGRRGRERESESAVSREIDSMHSRCNLDSALQGGTTGVCVGRGCEKKRRREETAAGPRRRQRDRRRKSNYYGNNREVGERVQSSGKVFHFPRQEGGGQEERERGGGKGQEERNSFGCRRIEWPYQQRAHATVRGVSKTIHINVFPASQGYTPRTEREREREREEE